MPLEFEPDTEYTSEYFTELYDDNKIRFSNINNNDKDEDLNDFKIYNMEEISINNFMKLFLLI